MSEKILSLCNYCDRQGETPGSGVLFMRKDLEPVNHDHRQSEYDVSAYEQKRAGELRGQGQLQLKQILFGQCIYSLGRDE